MRVILSKRFFAAALFAVSATLFLSTGAFAQVSGEVTLGKSTIEPAFDDMTGNLVFFLEPENSPFPVKANSHALAPLYAVLYPVASTVPADQLNCQPTNCGHSNVLPFPDADYGILAGNDPACQDFNAGQPCSPVKGHDHLLGVASTGGDFNEAWHVELVLFMSKAFQDGTINTPITTLAQLQSLVSRGEVFIVDTPISFDCALVSEHAYLNGTPQVIAYP
jgi:hypothetical protein